jgi:hypothetical protein
VNYIPVQVKFYIFYLESVHYNLGNTVDLTSISLLFVRQLNDKARQINDLSRKGEKFKIRKN